ncbi:zinc finger protein-like 1 homolog [Folsomia candida]|uniref:Zinc finger protein-like 1 homolog n=1 Tax=Folsomia candida TaxID=158441 RepID=A0A226EWZ8_FOLCA|nr:zinc finger protein-like 1 homolog [Folsomia candida]OXA61146.1 Zinc finger protein-like 1 [Folsomia candida]
MGLCKCPHRKVTNIFCFEHRVNVCEHCLMQNHPKCVVDTYRNWITDSVFSANCGICDQELASGDTVRLLCLHIVHWNCLDGWARQMSPKTAPAGYSCPICRKMCIFPAHNQISPIADELKKRMSQVNWARAGLGLSLLDNDPPPAAPSLDGAMFNRLNGNGTANWEHNLDFDRDMDGRMDVSGSETSYDMGRIGGQPNSTNADHNVSHTHSYNQQYSKNPYELSTMSNLMPNLSDSYGSPNSQPYFPQDPSVTTTRKSVKFDPEIPLLLDEEDKYRRRSPFESLSRWLRQVNPANKRKSRRRTALYVIGTIVGMIILLMLLFGRNSSSDEDDAFNLHANPHVLVGEGKVPLGHEFDP